MGSLAYKLELLENSQFHSTFHVSCLRKHLTRDDNVLNQDALAEFVEPPTLPHEPESIMDAHELRTQ